MFGYIIWSLDWLSMVKFQSRKWVLITNKVHVMSSRINWSGSSCFFNSTQSSSPRTIFHPSLLVDRRIFPTQIHFAFVWLAVEDECSNIFLCWIRLYHYTVEAIHGHKGVLQETIRHFILIAINTKDCYKKILFSIFAKVWALFLRSFSIQFT